MKKIVYLIIGLVATGLAIVGVWTPGLPTTPFLLVALWSFSQSNQRLHNWLTHAPIFKHAMTEVKNYEQHRAIKKKVKIISQSTAWFSSLLVLLTTGFGITTVTVVLAAISCSLAMYVIPTLKNDVEN